MSKRHTLFAALDTDGVPLLHCTGLCHGGRAPCNCLTGETELACEIGPDDRRVIQPPPPPVEPNHRQRANRLAMAAVIAGYLFLVWLLRLSGGKEF